MNEATALYSYVNMILLSILGGAFVIFLAGASWWAKDVHAKLVVATRFADKMEEWSEAHDKQDDSRHLENKERLERNQISIHAVRDQLATLAMKIGIQARRINVRDDTGS